jgi:hypothetical protein
MTSPLHLRSLTGESRETGPGRDQPYDALIQQIADDVQATLTVRRMVRVARLDRIVHDRTRPEPDR